MRDTGTGSCNDLLFNIRIRVNLTAMNFQKASVFLLGVITLGLVSLALYFAKPVLMPLVIAVLFSFVLGPAVRFLQKLHIPKLLAVIIVILMIIALFFLLGVFVYTSFNSFVRVFPKYQLKLQELLNGISAGISERFDISTNIFEDIDWPVTIRGYLLSFSGTFFEFLKGLFIITIFLIFLLLEQSFLRNKLEKAFLATTSMKIDIISEHINIQIGKYMSVKLLISAVTGILIWLSLTIIGMDFPVVWGFLGFLLNFIPSIGSTVHFIITGLMGFVQFYPDSMGRFIAVVACMLAIQSIVGNIIDPRLQGHRLDLSPFLVLFSLIFWGWLWGPIGMLLATPLTVAIKIVCENIPVLQPVSILMGKGTENNIKAN